MLRGDELEPVVIVGGGIMGLSCAYRLLQRGYKDVTVLNSADVWGCSKSAASVIRPAWFGKTPVETSTRWGKETLQEFTDFFQPQNGKNKGDNGVVAVAHYEFYFKDGGDACATPDQTLSTVMQENGWRDVTKNELQMFCPKAAGGFAFSTFSVEGRKFIPFLTNLCKDIARMQTSLFRNLAMHVPGDAQTEAWCAKAVQLASRPQCKIVINCCGLYGGTDAYPIRGDLVLVKAPALKVSIGEYKPGGGRNPFYAVPREDYCVLGSTYIKNDWDRTTKESHVQAILTRAKEFCPELQDCKVMTPIVCTRPAREEGVRLDIVPVGEYKVVNNYGHGGGGWSLCFGCATDVVECVDQINSGIKTQGINSGGVNTSYTKHSKL